MRTTTWLWLLVVTLLVVVAAAGVVIQRERATTADDVDRPLFAGLMDRINDTAAIEVTSAQGRFRIERAADGRWVVPERSGYPADGDKVKKTVVGLAELRVLEARTRNPELYGRIGVQDPEAEGSEGVELRLSDAQGRQLAALIVGKVRSPESGSRPAELYVREPEAARSWLAAARLDVDPELVEWLDRRSIRVAAKRVKEVVVTHADGERVRVWREAPSERDFTLADVPPGHEVDSRYKVNSIGRALDTFTFEDVKRADALDFAADAVAVRCLTHDGLVVTATLVESEDATWARFEADFDAEQAARERPGTEAGEDPFKDAAAVQEEVAELSARTDGWAYKLPAYLAEDLTRRGSDLVKKSEEKEGS